MSTEFQTFFGPAIYRNSQPCNLQISLDAPGKSTKPQFPLSPFHKQLAEVISSSRPLCLVLAQQGRLTMFYLLPYDLYQLIALDVPARTIFFSLLILKCYKI
jgi:hypothetical protein